ncbi:MAG: glycosyltransferase family 39 protein [bacterium]
MHKNLFLVGCVGLAGLVLVYLFDSIRFAFIYNVLPLFFVSGIIFRLQKQKVPVNFILMGILGISLILHAYQFRTTPSWPGGDSGDYLMYGNRFARGEGLRGLYYWPPLYPFFAGLCLKICRGSEDFIFMVQHFLLWLALPLIYSICDKLKFSNSVGLCACALFTLNSLCMQMAQTVMSEILYLFLVLLCIWIILKFNEEISYKYAVICALIFALASHCRQLLNPLFCFFLFCIFLINGKKAIPKIVTALLVFLLCMVPWSIRNKKHFNHFGISANLGINIFTKLTAFKLQNENAEGFKDIKGVFNNVLKDLDLEWYKVPEIPQADWQVNKIPHNLFDSLIQYHGHSITSADRLLTGIALKGFLGRPIDYLKAVMRTFNDMIFRMHGIFPKPQSVFPFLSGRIKINPVISRILRGFVYIPGWFLFFYIPVFLAGKKYDVAKLLPLIVCLYAYGLNAAVQIGFTRYGVPWIPFLTICSSYVLYYFYVLISGKTASFIEHCSGK